jgi:hypothetical protein
MLITQFWILPMLTQSLSNSQQMLSQQQEAFPGTEFHICANGLGHFAVLSLNEMNMRYWEGFSEYEYTSLASH